MNTRVLARGVATLTLTAGFGLAGSVAVDAQTTPTPTPTASPTPAAHTVTLTTLKEHCNVAVQRRLGTLGADDTFVKDSAALTSSDRTTLEGQISADEQGLAALDKTIQGDTTYHQAWTDCQTIVTGYRVYVLEDPKIHEVIAADGVTKVNVTFATLIPELQTLINNSSVSATVKAQAQADLNDLTSKVNASRTSISGVTASVINLVPAGWPGNQVDLKSAAQNIKTARTDLTGAGADANHIIQLLGS
ncbi:MAG TPA: hypothetical protein VG299_08795 [Candidatus Dormibacteraeota bacterium]|nr:hypothetical protein [Candidatus Dormibacteraeota bacterium]